MEQTIKKTFILYVFKVLYCYTSKKHTVTQTQITDYLHDLGISCDRKTVGRNIGYLMKSGVPVCRIDGNIPAYYYDWNREDFFALPILPDDEVNT